MPHVKNFIATHGDNWLNKLVEDYKIDVARDGNLVSLKYNMIESPMYEEITQECRGMVVLDKGKDSIILCHPYNKFWNHGEHLAKEIDWSSARIYDKLDGSLMLLSYHPEDEKWTVASSGHPTAGGNFGSKNSTFTFRDKFWEVFKTTKMLLPFEMFNPFVRQIGFFFELVAPDNRIVCNYTEAKLILHGARSIVTEKELDRVELELHANEFNWPLVKVWKLGSLEEVLTAVKELNPIENEGFVVVDKYFNRVKIKSPQYVALHHLRDKFTTRGIMYLWKAGEVDEVLTYFPENKEIVMEICGKLEQACIEAFDLFNTHKNLPTRKDFALAVKDTPYSSICFQLLSIYQGCLVNVNPLSLEDVRKIMRTSNDSLTERFI